MNSRKLARNSVVSPFPNSGLPQLPSTSKTVNVFKIIKHEANIGKHFEKPTLAKSDSRVLSGNRPKYSIRDNSRTKFKFKPDYSRFFSRSTNGNKTYSGQYEQSGLNVIVGSPRDSLRKLPPRSKTKFTGQYQYSKTIKTESARCGVWHPHPSIEIKSGHDQNELIYHNKVIYLKTYFDCMFYLGASPIRGDGSSGRTYHTIIFAVLSLLAIFHGLEIAKENYYDEDIVKWNLYNYITLWYWIFGFFLRIFFTLFLVFGRNNISRLLLDSAKCIPGINYKECGARVSRTAAIVAILVVLKSVACALQLHLLLIDFTPQDILLIRSYGFSKNLLIWDLGNSTNFVRKDDKLWENYGEDLSAASIALGTFGIIARFFGTIQEEFIRDILLMSTLHMFSLSKIYQSQMVKILSCISKKGKSAVLEKIDDTHDIFYLLFKEIEDNFGFLFKMVHASNWLLAAYIIYYYFIDYWHWANDIIYSMNIIKIACTYTIAAMVVQKSHNVKSDIDMQYRKRPSNKLPQCNEVNCSYLTLVRDNLSNFPIGIGCGNFLLDEGFLFKFVMSVVSSFLFFHGQKSEN